MDQELFYDQWLGAFILSPLIHTHMSIQAIDDEWAMWNNGGEL